MLAALSRSLIARQAGLGWPGARPDRLVVVDASIESFIEALWLEDGLSANTQAAYRRDLVALAAWLAPTPLDACTEARLFEYAVARPAAKATSANRRLSVFKRYFRWALR